MSLYSDTVKWAGYDSDYTINPPATTQNVDMRGVIDYGNLYQFAPFEGGYSFIAVINGPRFITNKLNNFTIYKDLDNNQLTEPLFDGTEIKTLQDTFISIIENEFRGLDGIEDITSDTMEITDNISTMSLISKVTQTTNSQLSMRFFEKTGALITKYIATYLRYIRDTKTEAKTYGGKITPSTPQAAYGPAQEVFNMLYVVTDSTCLHVEKAFLILNAQPTQASLSELYNTEKGQIETKEITVNWNCFVVDGDAINKVAAAYLEKLIKYEGNPDGKVNINSWDMDWSISGTGSGDNSKTTIKQLGYEDGKLKAQ